MKERKIESLDCIRGIACIIVLIAHIVSVSPHIGKYASGCGKIGVWCFMIMSGFLSIYPYINGAKDSKEYNFKSVLLYYLKKIKTLYPAFLVALLLGMYTGLIPSLESALRHLLCMESIGHFWYMPVIIKFYIIFPVFVILYRLVKENNLIYGLMVCLVIIVFCVAFPFTKCTENSNMLRWYVPVFGLGMLLAIIYNSLKTRLVDKAIFDIICIIFILGIVIFTPLFREIIWGITPSGWLQNKYLLMGILWSGVIFCVLYSKYIKQALGKSKIFTWISAISYEMYLIHYIVLLRLNVLVSDMVVKSLLVVVISTVLSVLVHFVFYCIYKKIDKTFHTTNQIKKEAV